MGFWRSRIPLERGPTPDHLIHTGNKMFPKSDKLRFMFFSFSSIFFSHPKYIEAGGGKNLWYPLGKCPKGILENWPGQRDLLQLPFSSSWPTLCTTPWS